MYCTIEDVKNYLLINIEEWFEPQVEKWIGQVSRMIDRQTNRDFQATDPDESGTEPETRKYDGTGKRTLFVDEFVKVASVKVDGQEIAAADYLLYPANKKPHYSIELAGRSFSRGRQNVEISAFWGYSVEVPEDIRFAATVLVAGIINNSNQHEGEVSSESWGRYTVTYRSKKELTDFQSAKSILKSFRRIIF